MATPDPDHHPTTPPPRLPSLPPPPTPTAAAFAKGLLQLDGEITPILVSLVRKDGAVNMLLDETKGAREDMDRVKQTISHLLLQCEDWESARRQLVPDLVRCLLCAIPVFARAREREREGERGGAEKRRGEEVA